MAIRNRIRLCSDFYQKSVLVKYLTLKLEGFASVLRDTSLYLGRPDLITSLGRCPDRIVNLNFSISRNGVVKFTKDWTTSVGPHYQLGLRLPHALGSISKVLVERRTTTWQQGTL